MKNRMLSLALSAVMTAFVVAPALAQDNFPDVPENHWAFEAIENLKREGILVGYPDGTYKGPRATTRYELAVALNAAYQRLKNITDGLAEQIAEIRRQMGTGSDKGLADRLAAVEAQLRGMSGLKDDVDAMKKMSDEFQKELAALGVDVEQMKKDLADIKAGMGGTQAVTISGDANVWVIMGAGDGNSSSGTSSSSNTIGNRRGSVGNSAFFGVDGRLLGVDDNGNPRGSIFSDLNIYHEIAVNLKGGKEGQPKWNATIVHGNLLGSDSVQVRGIGGTVQGLGNQSSQFVGSTYTEGPSDTYVQRFVIDLEGVLPFKATVGRQSWSTTNPLVYRRNDYSPYFENDRWDDGQWMFDGIISGFNLGGNGSLTIVAGKNGNRLSNNGVEIQPIAGGQVNSTFGGEAKFKIGDKGNLNLAYLFHSLNGSSPDRLEQMGAGLGYALSDKLNLDVNFAQNYLKKRGAKLPVTGARRDTATTVALGYKGDKFGLNGEFRSIGKDYVPFTGSWKRLTYIYNVTGIEDFLLGGYVNLSDKLTLSGDVTFGKIKNTNSSNNNKKYTQYNLGLDYAFGNGWTGMLGYESFDADFSALETKWATLGLRYSMNKNMMFKLMYQHSDINNGPNSGSIKGHMVSSQISVKF